MGHSNVSTSLVMIEPCFNELTIEPLCTSDEEVKERVNALIQVLKGIKKEGISKVRYERDFSDIKLKKEYTLHDYCIDKNPVNRNHSAFLYSILRRPYIDEDKEERFYEYDDAKFVSQDGKEYDCIGLYIAHITDSFTVGFNTTPFNGDISQRCHLRLKSDGKTKEASVLCITEPSHINNLELIDLISNQEDLDVNCCNIDPENKKRKSFPKHHGSKECKEFEKRILESKYVIEVINSIDFNSSERDCISKVYSDNKIDIRLTYTKQGYGVCILTSAKTTIQNHWIAKHIRKKYF